MTPELGPGALCDTSAREIAKARTLRMRPVIHAVRENAATQHTRIMKNGLVDAHARVTTACAFFHTTGLRNP